MNMQPESLLRGAPLVGRILLALLFLMSGANKALGGNFDGVVGMVESVGLPFASAIVVLVIIIEVGGGIALLLGWYTRMAATALLVFAVLTAILFHAEFGDQAQFTQFLKNLAISGGLLYVMAFGAGAYALDNKRNPARSQRV